MRVTVPGSDILEIMFSVFDFNGTIAVDGTISLDIREKLIRLSDILQIYVLTADTNGNAANECKDLPLTLKCFSGSASLQKAKIVSELGADRCVCFGNGFNDIEMFKLSRLSVAIIGEEGLCAKILPHADIVVNNINDGISLLLQHNRIIADLRS